MINLKKIKINTRASYDIFIERGLIKNCGKIIADTVSTRKIAVITDNIVDKLYYETIELSLKENGFALSKFVFPAGEASKSSETLNEIYTFLCENNITRSDCIIALGGGVVGDLTGFAAATYLRGIDFIQVPTTLLSQVDSSIGGKTGVDFMQYKNMVGAFYQPKLVYMNLSVLQSLPSRQIISGMGEIIKHGLIKDAAYYEWLMAHHDAILALEPAVMEEMIARSCEIKREVVEHDPTEKGERALLNFGHTIGHAIEKLCGFSLYHGECVGLGILAAAYLSKKQGNLTEEQLAGIRQCLSAFGFQTQIDGISTDAVLSATKSDKKMVGNQVKFILLHTIGDAYIYRELSDAQILDGIRYVCRA